MLPLRMLTLGILLAWISSSKLYRSLIDYYHISSEDGCLFKATSLCRLYWLSLLETYTQPLLALGDVIWSEPPGLALSTVQLSPGTWTAHVPTLHPATAQSRHPEPPLLWSSASPTAANSPLCPQHSPLTFHDPSLWTWLPPTATQLAGACAGLHMLLAGVNPAVQL